MTAEAVLFGPTGEPAPTTCLVSLLCVTQANMVLLADCASSCSMSFGESCGDHMKLWQVALFAYAVFTSCSRNHGSREPKQSTHRLHRISMVPKLCRRWRGPFRLEKGSEFASGDGFRCSCWSSQSASCSTPPQADPGGLWNELGLWLGASYY
jgi:hypothetical protein